MPLNPSYRDLPAYLRILPDGRVQDTRYRYGRGDRVMITSGTFQDCVGTVVSIVFQRSVDYPDDWAPGYQITLDNDTWAQVRWDQVRGFRG